jgi:hypothetical protein
MEEFTERPLSSESESATQLAMPTEGWCVEGGLETRSGVGAGAGVTPGERGLEEAGAVAADGGWGVALRGSLYGARGRNSWFHNSLEISR